MMTFSSNRVSRILLFLSLSTGSIAEGIAQVYPVQVTTQLVPPYSVYLPDYSTPGNDKLKLIMFQRDLTRPSYQVRLRLSVELNGQVILRTANSFNPPPITLQPGQPTRIEGIELQPYLETAHLDFIGISREEYERTKSLPEGSYQICITALDYRRQDVVVSNAGCGFYWLAKNEPPLINLPLCGTDIAVQNPQQIVFSWLPRNTTSPTSALDTEYEFLLYEIRPEGRNPNDVVLSSQPVFRSVTTATQLVYGPGDPALFKEMSYAWRVRAIDKNGRDSFRNNGYSEVCVFHYGGIDANLPSIQNVTAKGESERRAKASWMSLPEFSLYKVGYRKSGSGYEWYTGESTSSGFTMQDLEPDTEYEVRVQGATDSGTGPYSDVVRFKTTKPKVSVCGDSLPPLPAAGPPLLSATVGTIVNVQGIELTFTEVASAGQEGLYRGKGTAMVPYLGGASFRATFDQLFVDEDRVVTSGRIDFETRSVEEWAEEKLEEQRREELEEQQRENREDWRGTDFYEEVTYYEDIVIEDVVVQNGKLVVIGKDGLGNSKTYNNDEILSVIASTGKAVIIEDKNGDQWVVEAGGKISKVPGGGLSPNMDVVVDEKSLNIVEAALIAMYQRYTPARIAELNTELKQRREQLDSRIRQHNATLGSETESTLDEEQDVITVESKTIMIDDASDSGIDAGFRELSVSTKNMENEVNRAVLLGLIATPDVVRETASLVAPEIRITGKTVTEFINQQRIQRAPETETIDQVSLAIEEVLDKVIEESSVRNVIFKKSVRK